MTERSLLLVNYASAGLAAEAIRSARAASSVPLQVVVVDNTCDDGEARRVRELDAEEIVVSPRNAGYAGGINLGMKSCRGEVVTISNPDVVYGPAALDLLAAELGRFALTGPRLSWDDAGEWILPPATLPTLRGKAGEILASRFPAWARRRSLLRFRQRVAFWSATSTIAVEAVSGAVMCIERSRLERMGGFDERFALYFEESDFLMRLRRERRSVGYVAAARCRHLYNQSGGSSETARRLYVESEVKFYEKWRGESALRLMRGAGAAPRPVPAPLPPSGPVVTLPAPPESVVVELSPLADFEVAAGFFPAAAEVVVPREILASHRAGPLYLRVVDRERGAVLAAWQLTDGG